MTLRTSVGSIRVGLVGFGRAGRSVAGVLLAHGGVSLEWVVRRSETPDHHSAADALGVESSDPGIVLSSRGLGIDALLDEHPVDAIIDFSSESGVCFYADAAAERGVAIVCAVSAWSCDVSPRFAAWGRRTRALWSPNITVGVNFVLLAAQALRRMAPCSDVEILEEHFTAKHGVSGTALRLAAELGADPSSVKSIRAGGIVGNHEVLVGFPFEIVRLRHESIGREAFGEGAIFAAQHLIGRPNGVYRMEDLLRPYFSTMAG